ncbi:hypothetical protein F4782DRAFT_532264 [Xylaria castorea]|nr:hypothetical protein F4782DRAFT_532264 [Xylaria castorea]
MSVVVAMAAAAWRWHPAAPYYGHCSPASKLALRTHTVTASYPISFACYTSNSKPGLFLSPVHYSSSVVFHNPPPILPSFRLSCLHAQGGCIDVSLDRGAGTFKAVFQIPEALTMPIRPHHSN